MVYNQNISFVQASHRVQNHMANRLAEGLMAHYEEVEDEGGGCDHHRVE